MLDNLINLVKEQAGDAIISNPAIPNERNDEAIAETSNSIAGGLQGMLSGGGMKDLLNMFGGQNDATSTVTQNVSGGVIDKLVNKFGINRDQASGIAGALVPNVLKNLVNKTNDPGDSSFNIQDIFNKLSNGQTQGTNIQNIINKLTGGSFDKDRDGDTDLQDVMAMFNGNKQGGGSVLDSVKGLFN
jgi:hypothetical protein